MKVKTLVSFLLVCIFAISGPSASASAAKVKSPEHGQAPDLLDSLEITADGANVVMAFSEDGQFHYDYNDSRFVLTTEKVENTTKINVSRKNGVTREWKDTVTVSIPHTTYGSITGIAENGGLSLQASDSDIIIKNHSGAVTVTLPSEFTKTLSYTATSGSGSIYLNGNTNFNLKADISKSAVSVPESWPPYRNGMQDYNYTMGDGVAKINVDIKQCAFSFNE